MISDRALKRRVKRNLLNEKHSFLAVTALGNEHLLKVEIESLATPVQDVSVITGGVEFTAELDVIYEANLWLSTANRLLMRLNEFSAPNTSAFYNHIARMPWEQYVGFADSLSFSVASRHSALNHKRKVADIAASGAMSRLASHGLSPKVTIGKSAALEFFVRIENNRCTISFNTSGAHLHKRGWRIASAKAPIRETIAAAVLRRVGADRAHLIVDPFCGSGTFPIEAALNESNYPSGGNRKFAFESAPFFNDTKWNRIKDTAIGNARFDSRKPYFGFDSDPAAIAQARKNARQAGVSASITFAVTNALEYDYSALEGVQSHRCLLVTNLPYGTRLSSEKEVSNLTRALANKLNVECRGWTVAIVLKNAQDLEGLHLYKRNSHQFLNGGLRVSLISGVVTE